MTLCYPSLYGLGVSATTIISDFPHRLARLFGIPPYGLAYPYPFLFLGRLGNGSSAVLVVFFRVTPLSFSLYFYSGTLQALPSCLQSLPHRAASFYPVGLMAAFVQFLRHQFQASRIERAVAYRKSPALSAIPAGSPLRGLRVFVYLRPASLLRRSD